MACGNMTLMNTMITMPRKFPAILIDHMIKRTDNECWMIHDGDTERLVELGVNF